ncbi:MAG: DUF5752 family protein [Nitrospirota bacterium]
MMTPIAVEPFRFVTQIVQVELTGLSARTIEELLNHLRVVPVGVIYQHTHRFVNDHQFVSPEPPNDFAYWTAEMLGERRLGEQFAAVDIVRFHSLETLRDALIGILERYVANATVQRVAPDNGEFHFMKAVNVILPTPYQASTLGEFLDGLQKVSVHSLYHHMIDARLRLKRERNDFSAWMEHSLGEHSLARSIAGMDPYTQTLEGLRRRIARLTAQRIREQETA